MTLHLTLLNMVLALILLLFNWKVNRNALFLSVLMILIASGQTRLYLVQHAKDPFWLAILINNPGPLWSMIGPCLFFYVRSVLTDRFEFRRSDLLHTLPFWWNLIGIFPYLLTPFSYKLEVAQLYIDHLPAVSELDFNWMMSHEWVLMTRYSIQIGYALVCLWLLAGFRRRRKYDSNRPFPHSKRIFLWLLAVTAFVLLYGLFFFTITFIYFRNPQIGRNIASNYTGLNVISILLNILPAMVLIFPEILYGIPRRRLPADMPTNSPKPQTATAAPTDETRNDRSASDPETPGLPEGTADDPFRELGQRVLHYMEQEKPYLQQDFSIEQLAEMLDVPRHHLYYCFKNILQKKFVTFRTEYRVREAKGMLMNADLKEMTLEGIGRRCGFASRSAFYRLFTEQTGYSPGEYNEKNRPFSPVEDPEKPGADQEKSDLA
jgi:AraC-like DNA-binding protein/heme/copper-type cytochrome/quinol oxidase subunit 2